MKLFEMLRKKTKEKVEKKETKERPGKMVRRKKEAPKTIKSKYAETYKILDKPILSEKATDLERDFNQFVFKVWPRTNKIEIKKAIEAIYGVSPLKINIINVKGKQRKYDRAKGKTSTWKKAIVTIKQGERIEISEKTQ